MIQVPVGPPLCLPAALQTAAADCVGDAAGAPRRLSALRQRIGFESLHQDGNVMQHAIHRPLQCCCCGRPSRTMQPHNPLLPAGCFGERSGPRSPSRHSRRGCRRRRRRLLGSRHRHRQAGAREPWHWRRRHQQHGQAAAGQFWRGRHAGLCCRKARIQGRAAGKSAFLFRDCTPACSIPSAFWSHTSMSCYLRRLSRQAGCSE